MAKKAMPQTPVAFRSYPGPMNKFRVQNQPICSPKISAKHCLPDRSSKGSGGVLGAHCAAPGSGELGERAFEFSAQPQSGLDAVGDGENATSR